MVKMVKEKRKCYKSLVIITWAFVQSFSAYYVLEGLQSSVNPTVGLVSLSLIYGFYCISSMLLPSLVASKIKAHHTLAICQVLYMLYTAANFYPTAYTLIPSAVIMGLAAGPFWATARIYVGDLAKAHAKAVGKGESEKTGFYFGVFYMFQASQVIGNLLILLINTLTGQYDNKEEQINISTNHTITNTTQPTKCGIYYTKIEKQPSEGDDEGGEINYLVLSIFLAMQGCSALLFLRLTDSSKLDTKGKNSKNYAKHSPTDKNANLQSDLEENPFLEEENFNEDCVRSQRIASDKEPSKHGVMTLVNAMFDLLKSDKTALMVLTLSFHSGFLHCTVVGDFTRSWISCSKGVSYVPSMLAIYGCVSTASSLLSGPLLKHVQVTTMIYFAILVETCLWTTLLLWTPMPTDSIALYALFTFGFGISNGLIRSLSAHVFAVLYPHCSAAGMALLGSGEAISSSILFGLGDWTPPLVKILLSLVSGLVGGAALKNAWSLRDSPDSRMWRVKRGSKLAVITANPEC